MCIFIHEYILLQYTDIHLFKITSICIYIYTSTLHVIFIISHIHHHDIYLSLDSPGGACTYANLANQSTCVMCASPKPAKPGRKPKSSSTTASQRSRGGKSRSSSKGRDSRREALAKVFSSYAYTEGEDAGLIAGEKLIEYFTALGNPDNPDNPSRGPW